MTFFYNLLDKDTQVGNNWCSGLTQMLCKEDSVVRGAQMSSSMWLQWEGPTARDLHLTFW